MSHWETKGKSDDWYTPKFIFDALGCRFDLDVACPADRAAVHVPCDAHLWRDGLNEPWSGFVWMNAPFGGRNSLAAWMEKFVAHGNGIALCPDRTSAPWFQWAAKRVDAILFLCPKVKFERPDGTTGDSPSNGTALMAIGAQGVAALQRAATLGTLCLPITERT